MDQPRKLGQLINDGFKLFKENLVLFSKIVLVIQVPLTILSLIVSLAIFYPLGLPSSSKIEEYLLTRQPLLILRLLNPVIITLLVIFILIVLYLSILGSIAKIIGAAKRIKGEEITVIECYRQAFSKFWSYIWVELLAVLVVLGGIILLIVPGMIFAIWFAFVGYVVVLENIKGKKALSFSKRIVRGYFWKVVGNTIAISLLVAIIVWLIDLPASILNSSFLGLISGIIGQIVSVLVVVVILMLYFDLKKVKSETQANKT